MSVPGSLEVSLGLSVMRLGFGGGMALPDKCGVDFMYLLRGTKIKFLSGIVCKERGY